jgi:hypothetical protein
MSLLAAANESEVGPSLHIAGPRNLDRYRKHADIGWQLALGGSVANDPWRTFKASHSPTSKC